MAPNINDESELTSYKFQDSNDFVIIKLYAKGPIEQKDIEVLGDTDYLEVSTPGISE